MTRRPTPEQGAPLPPAVRAFDRSADRFDERFGEWASVAAQRRAVRRYLVDCFASGDHLLELGAGTAEDALYMLARGFHVSVTDGSPTMVARAAAKIREAGLEERAVVEQVVLERLGDYAERRARAGDPPFDGAYSNFAAFNCLADPAAVARPLASLLPPGAVCVLVVFGRCSPGELLVELLRGRPSAAVRRRRRGPVPARLGGEDFHVWYPSARALARALAPWFSLVRRRGIGILVPPSAAEPWISSLPRLVRALEGVDRVLARPLASLGDHVLLHFQRTSVPV